MTQVVRSQARMNPRAGQPSHSPARWARHLRSLPARQWAEASLPEPTSRAQSGNTCLLSECPVSTSGWRVGGKCGALSPSTAHCGGGGEVGLRKAVQIPGGPQAQFSGPRTVTHSTLAPTRPNPSSQRSIVESLVSLRLEGSIQETCGSCSHLISQTPGDDCRASP